MLTSIFHRSKEGSGPVFQIANDAHHPANDADVDDILMVIKAEHQQALRLLLLLNKEADSIERVDDVDYELINDVLDFFTGPMDKCHHSKEDLVYSWMRANVPSQAAGLDDVESDHQIIAVELAQLKHQINSILLDRDVPRRKVVDAIRAFVARQLNHIRMEEAAFIPLADMLLPDAVRRKLSLSIGS